MKFDKNINLLLVLHNMIDLLRALSILIILFCILSTSSVRYLITYLQNNTSETCSWYG